MIFKSIPYNDSNNLSRSTTKELESLDCNVVDQFGATDDDLRHLFLLMQSISQVDKNYLNYYWDELKKKPQELLERTFAYELYRQWQNKIEKYKTDLIVNAEIGKKISNSIDDLKKIMKLRLSYKEPDMVLHESHTDLANNIIVCEIKRNKGLSTQKIYNDILKICTFVGKNIWNGKGYHLGCFIVVDIDFQSFSTKLKSMKFRLNKHYQKIYCIVYNGKNLEYDTLYNIIKNK